MVKVIFDELDYEVLEIIEKENDLLQCRIYKERLGHWLSLCECRRA